MAFLVRTAGLDSQGYWYDEGSSVALASQGLCQILLGKVDHPPLYHLLLGLWVRFAGTTEFATRFLSVGCGVLVVLLTARLAASLVGRRAACIAALLLAVSPIEIWYSQEARMYALLSALTLASSICLIHLMQGSTNRRTWTFFVLANTAAVYTHYLAMLVFAVQAMWVLLQAIHRRSLALVRRYCTAQITVALALVPWLPVAWMYRQEAGSTYWPGRLSWQFIARETALAMVGAGLTISEQAARPILALTSLVVGLGLLDGMLCRRRRRGVLLLAVHVLVPFLVYYGVARDHPKFSPRYLLPVVPPFLTVGASGLAALWPSSVHRSREKLSATLVVALLAAITTAYVAVSANAWRGSSYGRDDLRGAARFLGGAIRPDESLILMSGHLAPAFALYYHRNDWFAVPATKTPVPSVDAVLTLDDLDSLRAATQGRRGVWLLLWQDDVVDPNGLVLGLLDLSAQRAPVVQQFRGLELRHYLLPDGLQLSREMFGRTPINASVGGDELVLVSCDLPTRPVPSGETATLLLHWKALRRTSRDYRLALQVLDEAGQVLAESGGRVAGWMYPTYRWRPDRLITARQDVRLPAGLPPGDYLLRARVFALGEQAALTIPLGKFTVGRALHPPTLAELGVSEPLGATLAELELLSCLVAPREAYPGQVVQATLIWRAQARPAEPYRVALSLGSRAWATLPLPASAGDLQADDALRMVCSLLVPPDAADGRQQVSLALMGDGSQAVAGPIAAGEIEVHAGERLFEAPASIANPLRADLGGKVAFLGYTLDRQALRPGESFHLDLYWQGVRRMDTSYTVFVHLLDGKEKIWGQVDSVPAHSTRPTTGWLPGEVVIDSYDVAVYPDAPPGQYVIEVGLYNAATGERLAAFDESGNHLWADRILLSSVQVLPPASGR